MPFGSNVKTVTLAGVSRESTPQEIKAAAVAKGGLRRVKVPEAEAPWWWSEYLTEEWKRKNRVGAKPRDTRTGLQRADEAWQEDCRRHAWDDSRPGSTGMPRHEIWGDSPA